MKRVIEELNNNINTLNRENINFQNNFSIKTGNSWYQWREYQEWIDYNIATIDTIKNIVKENKYRDSYILLRSVLEAYLIIKLSMVGNMYFFDLLPKKGTSKINKESSADLMKRAANDPNLINDKNLMSKKLIFNKKDKNNYKLRLIFKSSPVQNTSVFVPKHYFFARDYSSDGQYLSDLIIKNRWADSEMGKIKENRITNKNIRSNFLEIGSLIDFFKVNKFATSRQADAILVHYSYLSKFTHSTIESYKLNHHQFKTDDLNQIFKYDFTHELLILLYCNFLSLYFLELQSQYFSKEPDIEINKTYKQKIKEITNNNKYSFFWFIYNKPHKFDIMLYKYKKGKLSSQKNYGIPYYVNPFVRLRELNGYWPGYKLPEILSN